jgi:hypothetical protein
MLERRFDDGGIEFGLERKASATLTDENRDFYFREDQGSRFYKF